MLRQWFSDIAGILIVFGISTVGGSVLLVTAVRSSHWLLWTGGLAGTGLGLFILIAYANILRLDIATWRADCRRIATRPLTSTLPRVSPAPPRPRQQQPVAAPPPAPSLDRPSRRLLLPDDPA